MNTTICEEQRAVEQVAEILQSMASTQCVRPQSNDNAPAAQASSVPDVEMTDAAGSLLMLSTTVIIFEHHPAPLDSTPVAPAQSVPGDVPSVITIPTAPAPAVVAPVARRPARAPVNNPQWAGLTAAQQAQQQVRHGMTPWQRYQYNFLSSDHRDRRGNIIGRLYMTTAERHSLRLQQVRQR